VLESQINDQVKVIHVSPSSASGPMPGAPLLLQRPFSRSLPQPHNRRRGLMQLLAQAFPKKCADVMKLLWQRCTR